MPRPIIAVTDSPFPSLDPVKTALARLDPELRMSKGTSAEDIIAAGLKDLRPDALIVGEEAAALDAGLLAKILDADETWLIDPLDGTAHFAAGREPFAVMAALVEGVNRVAHGLVVAT